jgi:hypothetical protein
MGLFDKIKSALSSFAGADPNYYQKNFGLEPDEQVLSGGGGFFVPEVSAGKQAAAMAAGLLVGAIVEIVGEQFMFVITDKGRLVIGMVGGRYSDPIAFGPDDRPRIEPTNEKGGGTIGGPKGLEPAVVVRFVPDGGDGFKLTVAQSIVKQLVDWSQGD